MTPVLHDLLRIPLTSTRVLVPLDALAAVLAVGVLAWGVVGRRRRPIRSVLWRVGGGLAGASAMLVAVWWFDDVRDEFGVAFTTVTRMWLTLGGAAIGILIVTCVQGGWLFRAYAAGTTALVLLVAGLGVNVDFGAYRDLAQVVVANPYPSGVLAHEHPAAPHASVVDTAGWTAPAGMPSQGETLSVRIRGTVSHFHARKAVVWLPPAARTADPPTLPVLVALSGQPGAPSDLFESGDLGADLDHYAAAHHGLAPIVVAPDQLGAPGRNPMCVDSRAYGRAATYVMTDVRGWITRRLDVPASGSAWGIVGFSEGATCAMQFTGGHPSDFRSTLAISSELAPRNGSGQQTIDKGFGGSRTAYDAATPGALLTAHAPLGRNLIVFGYGQDDARYQRSSDQLRSIADTAGARTAMIVSPGTAHDWNTVRYVLAHGLPAVIAHTGLPLGAVR
jgi:dienelactone hydrolase